MTTKSASLKSELTTEIKSLSNSMNGRFDSLAAEIKDLLSDFKASFDEFKRENEAFQSNTAAEIKDLRSKTIALSAITTIAAIFILSKGST